MPDRYIPLPTRAGWLRLNLRRDPAAMLRVLRRFEPAKFAMIERFMPPGGVFVDVGANMGDFSVWAARIAGPAARVLAVEAEPANVERLRENVRRAGIEEQVQVAGVAAADANGEVELLVSSNPGVHSIVEHPAHHHIERFRPVARVRVPTRRLDELLAETGLSDPDMVKIDVEGAELLVLRGSPELLSGRKPLVLMMDVHDGVDFGELGDLLLLSGFRLYRESDLSTALPGIPADALSVVAVKDGAPAS